MDILIVLGGWFLAGVFALAAWSKLAEPDATAQALRSFGVPAALARSGAWVLPLLEFAVALLVVLPWAPALGIALAAGLLAVFAAAMAVQLAQGNKPSCNCFGQTRSQPISWASVARNGLLVALAAWLLSGALAAEGAASLTGTLVSGGRGQVLLSTVLVLAVGLLGWLVLHLARQQGRLLLKIDHLELRLQSLGIEPAGGVPSLETLVSNQVLHVGQAAPAFAATTVAGNTRTLADYVAQSGSQLLVFVGPQCAPCHEVMKEMASWRRQDNEPVHWLTISSGSAESNRTTFNNLAPDRVVLQSGQDINQLFGVIATPSALWVGADGRILSTVAVGRDAIRALYDAPVLTHGEGRALPLASA
ncbi:MAG: redoxin domain-containing protein [Rubrivivax sp.]|nr:MAG: redoxin domain-containing protein [Rubrivivax sp.]